MGYTQDGELWMREGILSAETAACMKGQRGDV